MSSFELGDNLGRPKKALINYNKFIIKTYWFKMQSNFLIGLSNLKNVLVRGTEPERGGTYILLSVLYVRIL